MVTPTAKIWDEPVCDGLRDCQDVAEEPTHYATVDGVVRVSVWWMLISGKVRVKVMVRVSIWWLLVVVGLWLGLGLVVGGWW